MLELLARRVQIFSRALACRNSAKALCRQQAALCVRHGEAFRGQQRLASSKRFLQLRTLKPLAFKFSCVLTTSCGYDRICAARLLKRLLRLLEKSHKFFVVCCGVCLICICLCVELCVFCNSIVRKLEELNARSVWSRFGFGDCLNEFSGIDCDAVLLIELALAQDANFFLEPADNKLAAGCRCFQFGEAALQLLRGYIDSCRSTFHSTLIASL